MAFQSLSSSALQPILTSQGLGWQTVQVAEYRHPAHSQEVQAEVDPVVVLTLAAQPHRIEQVMGERSYSGLYRQGDLSITPAGLPCCYQAEGEDHYLYVQIAAATLEQVAELTLGQQAQSVQLRTEFRVRNPECEQLLRLLRTELQAGGPMGQLYVDSLTHALAVHLLRHYSTATPPEAPSYEPGLSDRKLLQVTDYIRDGLDQDLKLADLAQLLGLSPFHFSRRFKQSLGLSPHQYLLQQRIERAKHLLKHSDQSLVEIALACGFNSHSHLTKQFRQLTGVTPKAYRNQVG